jgi:hypothetical protein
MEPSMLATRIRADGVREGICEDQLYALPHDCEIVPDPLFAEAARDEFFLDPRFYYLSRRDTAIACARTQIAAARDLEAMAFYLASVSPLLRVCACMLRAEAGRIVGQTEVTEIDREFEERSPRVKSQPSIIELGSVDGDKASLPRKDL